MLHRISRYVIELVCAESLNGMVGTTQNLREIMCSNAKVYLGV